MLTQKPREDRAKIQLPHDGDSTLLFRDATIKLPTVKDWARELPPGPLDASLPTRRIPDEQRTSDRLTLPPPNRYLRAVERLPKEEQERVDHLVAQLGADSYEKRERAQKELKELGSKAFRAVFEACDHKDNLEIRRRAREIMP